MKKDDPYDENLEHLSSPFRITPNNYRPINELCAKGCDYLKNDNSI